MKKGLKILLIVIAIIAIVLVGIGIYMSVKGNKKPITAEEFMEITSELGWTTSKVTTSSSVIDSYTAKKENNDIKFYVTSSELAQKNYDRTKKEYEGLKDISSVETTVSVNKYSKYTLTTDEYYMVVTKIDTTVMFAKVSKADKEFINGIFKELGY